MSSSESLDRGRTLVSGSLGHMGADANVRH